MILTGYAKMPFEKKCTYHFQNFPCIYCYAMDPLHEHNGCSKYSVIDEVHVKVQIDRVPVKVQISSNEELNVHRVVL